MNKKDRYQYIIDYFKEDVYKRQVLTMCDGFTLTPFMVTLPFLQALAASERVLNILCASSRSVFYRIETKFPMR